MKWIEPVLPKAARFAMSMRGNDKPRRMALISRPSYCPVKTALVIGAEQDKPVSPWTASGRIAQDVDSYQSSAHSTCAVTFVRIDTRADFHP
ncbi:hypothetical protein ACVBGC_13295 [Burkholderia stagnalis]